MFYLPTEYLINYLYSKMCNFNFISCSKGIVIFQSNLCNSIVTINCVKVNVQSIDDHISFQIST